MLIDSIKDIGDNYHQDLFTDKVDKIAKYSNSEIRVGTIEGTNKIFSMDLSDAKRIIMIGKAGSGKTFVCRGFTDRFTKSGYSVFIPTDIKNEFYSSRWKVQDKFVHNLDKYEKPEGQKLVSFRPTFFKDQDKKIQDYNYWMSIDLSDVTKKNFMTLVNASTLSSNQREILELLYDKIRKIKDFDLKNVNEYIDEVAANYSDQQRESVKKKFISISQNDFAEKKYLKYYRNIVDLFNKYNIALNMEGYDNYGAGSVSYPEVVLSMILKKIRTARARKQIKPMFIILEEATRFMGSNVDSCFKYDLVEGCDIDRRYDITYLYIVQASGVDSIPERIVKQCGYIFIPGNADYKTIQKMLVFYGISTVQRSVNYGIRLLQRAKKYKFSWIVLDVDNGIALIVKPFAPLSYHLETK